jgi:C4-type Zn-finger protein
MSQCPVCHTKGGLIAASQDARFPAWRINNVRIVTISYVYCEKCGSKLRTTLWSDNGTVVTPPSRLVALSTS